MKKNGQALVEYILIISFVGIIAIVIVGFFSGQIKDKITEITCNLTDKNYVSGEESGKGKCK